MDGKRPAEEYAADERRTRIKLTSESPEGTSQSHVESPQICEEHKTEVASNTTATSSSPMEPPSPESEVTSPQVTNTKLVVSADSSEEELQNSVTGSDNALLADTSEENPTSPTSNSDVDPGLPRNDYLDFEKCVICRTDRKNISYPYCSKCYKYRKNLFPERPKRRKKSARMARLTASQEAKEGVNRSSDFQDRPSENGSGSLSGSEALSKDSGIGSSGSQLSVDTVDGPSVRRRRPASSSVKAEPGSCRVCYVNDENGLFVHLTSAHLYGCYACAKEIWRNGGGCPLCRRKVCKITRLYH